MSNYLIKKNQFTAHSIEPGLYIAATPIGNLGDITLRVLETLAGCDVVACEDTRVSGKLLNHFGMKKKLIAYHEHNAHQVGPQIIEMVKQGKSVTLISDAGTPLISDPGFRLVDEARQAGINVWPLPGATAPIAALVASGLPCENFTFAGFLPNKQVARVKMLQTLSDLDTTLIFFESPKRVAKSILDLIEVFGEERRGVIARELTKLHEEIISGTLEELKSHFEHLENRGEFVILLAPRAKGDVNVDDLLLELMDTMTLSKAASEAAQLSGKSKRDLYQRALELKQQENPDGDPKQ